MLNMLYKEKLIIQEMFVFVTENSTLEKQDTFVEKLVTQIIKNLQVQISNIHVRYEDNVRIVILKTATDSISKTLSLWCKLSSKNWVSPIVFPQVTNPDSPLSIGVSLKNLSLQVWICFHVPLSSLSYFSPPPIDH